MFPEVSVEYVRCNLCGADDATLLFRVPTPMRYGNAFGRGEWDIVRCRQCGLCYVNPRLDGRALQVFYAFENPADQQFVQAWFVEGADLQAATWQRFVRTLHHHLSEGQLLDVGCGAGSFLVEARKAGYEVVGQEIAPYFLTYCREQLGLTIYDGELDRLGLPIGSFDCVTAFDVIEHHPDPMRLLTEMRRLLRPDGLAMISTHDIGNIFAQFYGARWRHIHPIGHLTYFTRASLTRMLESCGFRVLRVGGLHTIDATLPAEIRNWSVQVLRVILLRALVLASYRPLTELVPALTRWHLKKGSFHLDHERLMLRVGSQIIINDDMIVLATTA
jgi:2-polyprenyl-3-methyl-5-hydroxy-6-metoxy-1,4-benzoquinol methylase